MRLMEQKLKSHLVRSIGTIISSLITGVLTICYIRMVPGDAQTDLFCGFLLFTSIGLLFVGVYTTILPLLTIWVSAKLQKTRDERNSSTFEEKSDSTFEEKSDA